jgi:hypothetical protein
MSATQQSSRVAVLIKALPQPSKTYGETVCCAGVTADGRWKRLFPVRFRHLQGSSSFSRWDWVRFGYRVPTRDNRVESCHVYEDSIAVECPLPQADPTLDFGFIMAEALAFSPGQPEISQDDLGRKVLNLWRPPGWREVSLKREHPHRSTYASSTARAAARERLSGAD